MTEGLVERELRTCRLCPRRCGARRLDGESGVCGAGAEAMIASATTHVGEEPPISGARGSGTLFFSYCPLSCCFCQNYPISQIGHGTPVTVSELAEKMRRLEKRGAHNINVVTGTQFAPHIITAVRQARREGMAIPVVWNSSGYETPETIDLLEGTVDIYLTDIKYADDEVAVTLSGAEGYFAVATAAAKKMFDQVGSLQLDKEGIGTRGVIIRHMVLPEKLAGTRKVMTVIHETFGDAVPVSLMGQYFPAYRALEIPPLERPLTQDEYEAAMTETLDVGIEVGWVQELDNPCLARGA
jgi:putative pyruvate formate lyase activating enzyme